MDNKNKQFAKRIANLKASPIREILHVLERPGMISFAGGLPSSETFPALNLSDVPASVMQYGPSEGDTHVREMIRQQLAVNGLQVETEQILVLSGSQQGIDLVAKLYVEEGTKLAVEDPTYLAALQVFQLFGAEFQVYQPTNIRALCSQHNRPTLLYTNPTFQNPTGYCYSEHERRELARACDENNIVLFEDDPYRDLAYESVCRLPIASLIQKSRWIYQSSFSKTFAPGLRLGFLACSKDLAPYLTRLKQAADLHSNRMSQHLVWQQMSNRKDSQQRLQGLLGIYREKRDTFNYYLSKYLSDYAVWEIPKGGLFFWLKLKSLELVDTRRLLENALKQNVAFMPGEAFFAGESQAIGQLRLNFSMTTSEQMKRGLALLAQCINEYSVPDMHQDLTATMQ